MSWLEDFSDGEAMWRELMRAPTFERWLEAQPTLTAREVHLVLLYHAIREKQASGEWQSWTRATAD